MKTMKTTKDQTADQAEWIVRVYDRNIPRHVSGPFADRRNAEAAAVEYAKHGWAVSIEEGSVE